METQCTVASQSREWLNAFRQKAARRRLPLAAMLELTSRCNLRCVHCYLGPQEEQQRKRAEELSTEQIKRIIDQLVEVGTLYLTITGGDPMMRRDFVDIYRYAREHGLLVTVFCDGILVHDQIIDLFRDLPPRTVEVSLYGATAETYERVTRVPGSFPGAMRGIRRLLDNGIRVCLKTVLMTINSHELPEMEAIAKSFGVPFRFDGAIFPCLPNGSEAPLAVRLKPEELVAHEMASPERRRAWVETYRRAQAEPDDDRVFTCGAGQNSLYIDPYGQLSPCLMTTHHRFSLKDKSLRGLWDDELAAVRQKRYKPGVRPLPGLLRGACSHCPGVNQLETGSETQTPAFIAELARLRHEAIQAEERAMIKAE